jgi:Cytochrome C assembly protein
MHNLEQLIAEWRKTLRTMPGIEKEMLNELEDHLRDAAHRMVRSGVTEMEAFERAAEQLGPSTKISAEFQKLEQPLWLPVKFTVAIGIVAALALALFLTHRLHGGGSNILLASHVLTLTLGYLALLLAGALGICFVCQRCFSDFSARQTRFVAMASFRFVNLAAWLTAIGIVLGMIWARSAWGRWWAWDPKETAALCVLVWSICFIAVNRLCRPTARVDLLMSIWGNMIVSLAWLGPNLLAHLQNYGTSGYSLLLILSIAANLAFFLVGWAPSGCPSWNKV